MNNELRKNLDAALEQIESDLNENRIRRFQLARNIESATSEEEKTKLIEELERLNKDFNRLGDLYTLNRGYLPPED